MLVGLQGSGKTTHVGKLGAWVRKKYKKKPIFIACDIYRPAAILVVLPTPLTPTNNITVGPFSLYLILDDKTSSST